VKQFLGKGTFASVYSAREIATGKLVAVKIIDKARFARNKRLSKTINDETIVMMAIERHVSCL
jgi:serine/threonine protein kinase